VIKGKVVRFFPGKGYGFIRSPGLEGDVFVHVTALKNGKTLTEGQTVTFETRDTPRGVAAANVVAGRKQLSPFMAFFLLAVTAATLIGLYFAARGNSVSLAYLTAINAVTLLAYGYDKMVAGSSRPRIPETLLHLLALVGGTPGAFLGQRLFRHKTTKGRFQLIFWTILILQAVFLGWFYFA